MRIAGRALVLLSLVVASSSCAGAGNPDGGCPRPGLDSSRRCKRLCVLNPRHPGAPLSCTCMAECLCWQMSGHSMRPSTSTETDPFAR